MPPIYSKKNKTRSSRRPDYKAGPGFFKEEDFLQFCNYLLFQNFRLPATVVDCSSNNAASHVRSTILLGEIVHPTTIPHLPLLLILN
ncbi:MAG: hypothetical protein LVR00_08550 [Rhabdochlamydiaceae bacterium]